jgi:Flp pilus assembly protein TadB
MAPGPVWRDLAAHPQLGPLGRAVGRAHETGAAMGDAVHRLAVELREREQAEVEARARSIEVRAAAPLGLCLLPAFMVLGVVPMVAAVFGAMSLFQ